MAEDHASSGLGEWLYVRGGHCSVGSDAASIKSNQIKPNQMKVFLCQYISKVMQGYKYSSGYKVNIKAKWKMADFSLFCLGMTQNNKAVISTGTG